MNKNILVIGLGGIGLSIAERLKSFGGIVDALTNEVPSISYCLNRVFYNEKDLNLSEYDIVISAAPLTYKTKSMFNYQFFKSYEKTIYFY